MSKNSCLEVATALPPELRRGNVVRSADLLAQGVTRSAIQRAAEHQQIVRLRDGWYALPGADDQVVRAVRSGGVLSCVSALALAGVWRPADDRRVHVRSRRGRVSGEGLRGCSTHLREHAPSRAVDPLDCAIRCLVWCLPRDEAIACLDSVLHLGLATPTGLRSLLPAGWIGPHLLLDRCDRAESGSESLVRLRLRRRNLRVRTQVAIPGVGRVDLLVGDRLVIEVDSVAHHTAARHYHADRLRDQRLIERGYRVVRVTWEQVMFEWSQAELTILAVVHRGEHRWGRQSG